ncbi:MAG: SsrA-binding protein SmpB [Candidatus Omnitrophota bacterium]
MEDRLIAKNRKAFFNYTILDSYEAGIELKGPEVKSIRQGNINLAESFAMVDGTEIFLLNMHIAPYEFETIETLDPLRPRKLLLHKKEIAHLSQEVMTKHLSLVPLRLYLKRGLVKVVIALGKGKKLYDKRRSIKDKEVKREMRQSFGRKSKGK